MYDEDLENFDQWLRRLKIEYHIFLNGNRKKAPDDLRIRVEKLIKKLSESPDMSFSQRFRFTTLVTRFYVYRDLWRRNTLEREMGADPKTERAPERSHAAALRISISDPRIEEDKIHQLYDALVRIKGEQQPAISYPQFALYIAKQTRSIQEKYGCSRVAFSVALEQDSVRFTAAADRS